MVREVIAWMSEKKPIIYVKELVSAAFYSKVSFEGLAERRGTTKCMYFAIIKSRNQT